MNVKQNAQFVQLVFVIHVKLIIIQTLIIYVFLSVEMESYLKMNNVMIKIHLSMMDVISVVLNAMKIVINVLSNQELIIYESNKDFKTEFRVLYYIPIRKEPVAKHELLSDNKEKKSTSEFMAQLHLLSVSSYQNLEQQASQPGQKKPAQNCRNAVRCFKMLPAKALIRRSVNINNCQQSKQIA